MPGTASMIAGMKVLEFGPGQGEYVTPQLAK
jgi:hypothetical protein